MYRVNFITPEQKDDLIVSFAVAAGDFPGDILSVLFAQHLGCNYIASFDKDFQRVRQIIKLATNMELLCSPEEILKII